MRTIRGSPASHEGSRPARTTSTFDAQSSVAGLFFDLDPVDRFAVTGERPLERRDGIGVAFLFESQISQMFVNGRTRRQTLSRLAEWFVRQIESALAEIRPAKTVEERGIRGLD